MLDTGSVARAQLAHQVLEALRRREPQAAFVAEIAATIHPAPQPGAMDDALRELAQLRHALVLDHAAPDVHLEAADLRVVARVLGEAGEDDAREAAEHVWDGWLRAFLSTHRCQ